MKHQFKSRKDVSKYLAEKGIDTSNWTEEKWLILNKGQSEIHMMALAEAMYDAYNESTPKQLQDGEWHVPFGDNIDLKDLFLKPIEGLKNLCDFSINNSFPAKVKIATARCARVSYTVVGEEGKESNYENDIKLHNKLAESGHWSPFEHCAKVPTYNEYYTNIKGYVLDNETTGWFDNFHGFIPYRHLLETKQ